MSGDSYFLDIWGWKKTTNYMAVSNVEMTTRWQIAVPGNCSWYFVYLNVCLVVTEWLGVYWSSVPIILKIKGFQESKLVSRQLKAKILWISQILQMQREMWKWSFYFLGILRVKIVIWRLCGSPHCRNHTMRTNYCYWKLPLGVY